MDAGLGDVRLFDEHGIDVGVIVAPRRGVVLAANGPTIYVQPYDTAVRRDGGRDD